jgi:hypothetical protein
MENAALDLERVAAGRDSLVTGSVRVTRTEALGYQLVRLLLLGAAIKPSIPSLLQLRLPQAMAGTQRTCGCSKGRLGVMGGKTPSKYVFSELPG